MFGRIVEREGSGHVLTSAESRSERGNGLGDAGGKAGLVIGGYSDIDLENIVRNDEYFILLTSEEYELLRNIQYSYFVRTDIHLHHNY